MIDLLSSFIVIVLGLGAVSATIRGYPTAEKRIMMLSLLAHVIFTVLQITIARARFEGGDMTIYMQDGSLLARAIEVDPDRFGLYWFNLLFQREQDEVLPLLGAGSSTGSMVALTAALALVFRYSIYAAGLAVAIAACISKLFIYRTFREHLAAEHRNRLMIAILFVPSVVLWSSGIVKEAFALVGIGPVWFGMHLLLRGRWIKGPLFIALGGVLIQLVKPYTLFPLTVAMATWFAADRTHAAQKRVGPIRVRPLYIVLAALLILGGLVLIGQINPRYALENVSEDLTHHQRTGSAIRGESYYQGVDLDDTAPLTLGSQLTHAPVALFTALFRPFLFEARNAFSAVAALETTIFTVLAGRLLFRLRPRGALRDLFSHPILIAALVFVAIFGTGVSLATKNFGSLSRYRMPLIPFYAATILVLGASVQERSKLPIRRASRGPSRSVPRQEAIRGGQLVRGSKR
jgi:hypothetical protein